MQHQCPLILLFFFPPPRWPLRLIHGWAADCTESGGRAHRQTVPARILDIIAVAVNHRRKYLLLALMRGFRGWPVHFSPRPVDMYTLSTPTPRTPDSSFPHVCCSAPPVDLLVVVVVVLVVLLLPLDVTGKDYQYGELCRSVLVAGHAIHLRPTVQKQPPSRVNLTSPCLSQRVSQRIR